MPNIIGNKNKFFILSGLLIGAAVLSMVLFGFREGIDFRGGALWQFSAEGPLRQSASEASGSASGGSDNPKSATDIENIFKTDLGQSDLRVNFDPENKIFLVRLGEINETDHQKFLGIIKNKIPQFEELSFQSIGPSIGAELRKNAVLAIILVLVGISLFIAWAFRKTSRPVSSWKYGWVTLVTLFHDVVIPAGLLAYLGHARGVEIDGNFVVALLVVMGFSVHDTIVVFDRIRENLMLSRGKESFESTVNASVNQTIARSVNTSFTLILVLLALYFAGPINLHYFVLTLLVGVTTGIYSSIFIASPLLVVTGKQKS